MRTRACSPDGAGEIEGAAGARDGAGEIVSGPSSHPKYFGGASDNLQT